jgi:hypothetical protein
VLNESDRPHVEIRVEASKMALKSDSAVDTQMQGGDSKKYLGENVQERHISGNYFSLIAC